MPALLPNVDPEGLLEYSVVFTDRSLNHMSQTFQTVMNDISSTLKSVYNAEAVAVVPGGGTYAMEAVARQFSQNKKCLVIRNGWFSYRWSQILETANITDSIDVLKAQQIEQDDQAPFAPPAIETTVAQILQEKPDIVFAPHVETASGIVLPDDYISALSNAVHQVGGIMVLDCIASGALWIDMKACGVDVLLSAPQKGWSSSPCAGLVMMSNKAVELLETTTSSSFSCDLKKWRQIMQAYENGGHAYHATMPTDALKNFRDAMTQAQEIGFDQLKTAQIELGQRVRALLSKHSFNSVAATGFKAPGVVVSYTKDNNVSSGKKFAELGLQVAAGVPLSCDEKPSFQTFRIGLFGLDKLQNIDRTVASLELVLNKLS